MRFIFRSFRLSAPRATSAAEVNITPALPKGAKRQTPKTRRPAKGSPTRGAVTAKHVTERFTTGSGCWGQNLSVIIADARCHLP